MNVVAHEAVVAGDYVGADFLVGVTLVGISRGVVDGCGEVVLGQLVAAWRIWLVITATSPTTAPSTPALRRRFSLAGTSLTGGRVAIRLGRGKAIRRWNEDRMLGRIQQVGRDLVGSDSFCSILFLVSVRGHSADSCQLLRLFLVFGEGFPSHFTLDSAQRDSLAENIHAHHLLLTEAGDDDLAFLGEALAALNVEFVLVAETTH